LLQDAIEIAAQKLAPQNTLNFMLKINDFYGDISNAPNAQVAWLSNFAKSNLDWKKLNDQRYNDILKALHSSGRVRKMIMQHHTVWQRNTWATEKLRNLWKHFPEYQEI